MLHEHFTTLINWSDRPTLETLNPFQHAPKTSIMESLNESPKPYIVAGTLNILNNKSQALSNTLSSWNPKPRTQRDPNTYNL